MQVPTLHQVHVVALLVHRNVRLHSPLKPFPAPPLPAGAPQGGRILLPSLGTKAQRLGSRMAEVLPGSCALPSPEQWLAWHSNVITPFRKTGASALRVGRG